MQIKVRIARQRRGTAVAEFAMVVPLFVALVLGMFEFGRGIMVQQMLVNASREGARTAVVDGATTALVVERIESQLSPGSVNGATIEYYVNDSIVADPTGSNSGSSDAIGVEVSIAYADVSWFPLPRYLAEVVLRARSDMRRETSQ